MDVAQMLQTLCYRYFRLPEIIMLQKEVCS